MVDNCMNFRQPGLLSNPPCILCQASCETDQALCERCESTLPLLENACPCCALPLQSNSQLCGGCLSKKPAFDCVRSPLQYKYPVDELVSRFKYHHALTNGRLLGEYFARYIATQEFSVDALIPLPLHPQRLRKRGFNQSAELTHWISRSTGIPWHRDILQRTTSSRAQRRVNKRERRINVKGVFSCSKVSLPARVAIIDDVVTTGATAEAAAHCLKQAGISWVEIWAMARTPRPEG